MLPAAVSVAAARYRNRAGYGSSCFLPLRAHVAAGYRHFGDCGCQCKQHNVPPERYGLKFFFTRYSACTLTWALGRATAGTATPKLLHVLGQRLEIGFAAVGIHSNHSVALVDEADLIE